MTHKQLLYAGCTIEYGFKRIGGKYKARILWYVNELGVLRFGELKKMIAGITTKMLTTTLSELVSDGLLTRTEHSEKVPKVEYSITHEGKRIIPIIEIVMQWAEQQLEKNPAMQKNDAVEPTRNTMQ
ncbi:winged helix-turn-helix transcriptional regulator [Longitalea arenae]|uniref:winged helix-turn-helix transcriptional regulator n=1 Tax=Longitalea arenae TaxID=2812558 RepID=UPI0019684453|nr:helix-turn-helix domain-containing protein [Longitalea arenae]